MSAPDKGVRAVLNRIDIEPPTRHTGYRLTQRVNEALLFAPVTESSELAVTAEDGTAALTGKVADWTAYDAARENAFEGGALTMVNRLQIDRMETE